MALGWVAAILLAPLALAHGVTWLPAIVYEAAGLICHQRPERSFHLAGVQLPVCARCFGLYASGAMGALAAHVAGVAHGEAVSRQARAVLAIAAVPTALTVAAEWTGLAHPTSALRAISAVPLGAAAGWIFVHGLLTDGVHARVSRADAL